MAHPDLDELLNAVLPFAQQMLTKRGQFLPIGATMSKSGEVGLAAGVADPEHSSPQEVIDILTAGFRQQLASETIRACAICYDGQVIPPGGTQKADAICARLEHRSGDAAAVFLPYRKGFLGRIKFGELFASGMECQVFGKAG